MTARRQKHLVLILAREFASNLSTPTLIVDDEGTLVFFNEAAEEIIQQKFTEIGEVPFEEWSTKFDPRTVAAEPLPPESVRRTSECGSQARTAWIATSQ